MSPSREHLRRIIEDLPDSQIEEAERRLEDLRDGIDSALRAVLNAPVDDEPVTDDELRAIEEGIEAERRGDLHRLEDVKRELGL